MFSSTPCKALALAIGLSVSASAIADAQTAYYTTNGTEYPLVGALPYDQMFPDVALSANGGFVVWQDYATDGSGWGLSASRLEANLTESLNLSHFRVNATGDYDQEKPRVAMLKDGGAVFVWQGGQPGYQHIYGRFLTATNTFRSTNDLAINATTNCFQLNPSLAVLNNSNVVVVWASLNQAGPNSLQDVYAKILSPTGTTVKSEFLVNQFISFNQRSPVVTALKNGGFAVAWVSEQQRVAAPVLGTNSTAQAVSSLVVPSVDIYARLFQSSGTAAGNEFRVNADNSPGANPAIASAADGSFMVAWSAYDTLVQSNGWDVCARPFDPNGVGGTAFLVNTHTLGDQYAPLVCALGKDYLLAWTSDGQDGSREGVYGRFVHEDGTPTSAEFQVNTTTASQQMQPAVASDGGNQFLAVWTSFTGLNSSFDVYAQRFINVDAALMPMPAPFVFRPFVVSNGVYQPQLQVVWKPLDGIVVSNYEVYVDGAATPMAATTSNVWVMTAANGLTANSTHSFQIDYVKPSGSRPPLSAATSQTTWGGMNWGGVPFEWMTEYYGSDVSTWPSPNANLPGGNLTLAKIFLSGGNPLDPSTWLTQQIVNTKAGVYLFWNTQPGLTYQVQVTTDFANWTNVGDPHFATDVQSSVLLGQSAAGYYRILLVR